MNKLPIKSTSGYTESSFSSKFPKIWAKIINFLEFDDLTFSEKVWLFKNKLKNPPICLNCDKRVKFIKFSKGYRKFCSSQCSALFSNRNEETKYKRTEQIQMMNKDPIIKKQWVIKSNSTRSKFSEEKKEEIKEKRKTTTFLKYGVDNISKVPEIKEKIRENSKDPIIQYRENDLKERISKTNYILIFNTTTDLQLSCKKCNQIFEISRKLFNQRNRFNITICLKCNPNNNNSDFELKINEFIKSSYDGEIIDRYKKEKKYEIDIFLPDLNIGFECNGLWWHSENYKENNYHKEKTKFFSDKGIQIIHIWEDDWKFKKDIIKSRILNMLGKSEKVYARNCEVREISTAESRKFLIENHLQGNVISKIRYGLYNKENLISVMTFGNQRKNLGRNSKEGYYELLRFCNKLNTSVIGGASKLLNHFIKNNQLNEIISYASKDWSIGNLYQKIGFEKISETSPNYFYFHKDHGIRINRFNFRKDQLIKDGYDKNLSEHQIMNSRNYYRIYDSGSFSYRYIIYGEFDRSTK